MKRMVFLAVTVMMVTGSVRTAGAGMLYPVDGVPVSGALVSIGADRNIVWRIGEDKDEALPAEDVERLVLSGPGNPPPGEEGRLVLSSGIRLTGRPAPAVGKGLVWTHPVLGNLSVAFEDARVYVVPASGRKPAETAELLERLLAGVRDSDVIYMVNGDSVEGVVESIGPAGVGFNCKVGRLDIQSSNLLGVSFSKALKPYEEPRSLYAEVRLTDGSRLVGGLTVTGGQLQVTIPSGAVLSVPQESAAEVLFRNTRLVYLSTLEPFFVKETPYFDRVWPWQRDRSVWGRAPSIGARTYEHALAMHARSQLDFALDGNYRTFLSDVGIDGEVGQGGDCVVALYGDGNPLMEPVRLTGKSGGRRIRVDVSNVNRLTLLVDFGQGGDVGDHVTWGDARLTKK